MAYCPNFTCYALHPCPQHEVVVVNAADSSATLTHYAQHNLPAIWDNATQSWGTDWSVARLAEVLGSSEMKNVFVSADGRFTFFKAKEQGQVEERLLRKQMPFSEFVSRARHESTFEPLLCPQETYYLYGEPLPVALQSIFTELPLLQPVKAQFDLTSSLLWVAVNGSCSPLHYDLSEGVLAQVVGTKRVTLFPPSAQLYPYPTDHPHDRQSSIPNIHRVARNQFPLFDEKLAVTGELRAGQMLFIPFGWWHQIESDGENVSVSFRWNPHENAVRKLALGLKSVSMLPPAARCLIQSQLLKDVGPPHVQAIYKSRFAI